MILNKLGKMQENTDSRYKKWEKVIQNVNENFTKQIENIRKKN
jgi:hypothetical protein